MEGGGGKKENTHGTLVEQHRELLLSVSDRSTSNGKLCGTVGVKSPAGRRRRRGASLGTSTNACPYPLASGSRASAVEQFTSPQKEKK